MNTLALLATQDSTLLPESVLPAHLKSEATTALLKIPPLLVLDLLAINTLVPLAATDSTLPPGSVPLATLKLDVPLTLI
jgi:hypothetical protein